MACCFSTWGVVVAVGSKAVIRVLTFTEASTRVTCKAHPCWRDENKPLPYLHLSCEALLRLPYEALLAEVPMKHCLLKSVQSLAGSNPYEALLAEVPMKHCLLKSVRSLAGSSPYEALLAIELPFWRIFF